MLYDIELTPAQLEALHEWAEVGGAYPGAVLLVREGENIVAGQGDARVRISPAGDTVDHPEPYTGDEEPCTCKIGGYRQSPGNAGWTAHAADCPVRTSRELSAGERIARMGRELIDPDYDPAATDDDGVPLFSDETRAAAQDDPRGERDR